MKSFFSLSARNYERILYVVLCGVIVFNVVTVFINVYTRALGPDEFQHVHIVWNMFYNDLLIYKDFWEHHGVIYPVVNFLLLTLFKAEAGFEVYYLLRIAAVLFAVLYLILSFKVSFQFFQDKFLSVVAVAFLSSTHFFQSRAIEIRPDMLQNLFWLGGLYVVLRYFNTFSVKASLCAGILFGLSIATNTKMFGAIGFVFLFLFLHLVITRTEIREKFVRLVYMGSGLLSVHVVIWLFFLSRGALTEYLVNAYYANFLILGNLDITAIFIWMWERSILPTFGVFLLLSFIGLSLLLWKNRTHVNARHLLLLFVTLGCLVTAPFGPWVQYYLTFIPLLAVIVAYLLREVVVLAKQEHVRFLYTLSVYTLIFISLYQPSHDFSEKVLTSHLLQTQIRETEQMLTLTSRDEAVGFVWSDYCGGYVFNADVHYYWIVDPVFQGVYKTLAGEDILSGQYKESLKNNDIKFIVAPSGDVDPRVSKTLRDYLSHEYDEVENCLFKKSEIN